MLCVIYLHKFEIYKKSRLKIYLDDFFECFYAVLFLHI